MSAVSREQHINQALTEYRSRPMVDHDTSRIPLRGNSVLLEVVQLPLEIPYLNADSFRIAPALEDHPLRDLVRKDPQSPEAQRVVSELVRKSHRHADRLKESLLADGQDQPGVITRSGKLINANTRCVLLRELVQEGRLTSASIRVAVLPTDTTNGEQLGLESVLQQQQEYKDEYNLVSKLMMIQKLHSDAGMSDQQIAASLREKSGPRRISDLREVLVLMERARNLSSDPRPLSAFVAEKDQQQNWLELLKNVREIENLHGRDAGNDFIRGWLVAYYSGHDSVHQLRSVRGKWVERDVLPDLQDSGKTGVAVAGAALTVSPEPTVSPTAQPAGLDLLDDEPTPVVGGGSVVQQLLDIVVEAKSNPDEEIELPSGEKVSSSDVMTAIRSSVRNGLDAVKRRTSDQNRLTRPQTQADAAEKSLKAVLEALDEVVDEPEFAPRRADLIETVELIQSRVDELRDLLGMSSHDDDDVEIDLPNGLEGFGS